MLLALLTSLALQQVEPPRTVNDAVIGTAEQFRTPGPSRICLLRTVIDVRRGETAYLDYLGIHWGAVRILGPRGTLIVKEGDSWAEPRSARYSVDSLERRIARVREQGAVRYLIYGRSEFARGGERPVVWVEGDALAGRDWDYQTLERIDLNLRTRSQCERRFLYGWEALLGPGVGEDR